MNMTKTALTLALATCCVLASALPANAAERSPAYDISISLPVQQEGQYHRPYVAVWIEDNQQQVQRNIALWKQKDKWLPDLKRYYRRVLRANQTPIDGFTSATKGPGTYHLQWDGNNEQGQKLAAGSYQLCIEAAREKGGREIQCLAFNHGSSVAVSTSGEHELAAITLTFVP